MKQPIEKTLLEETLKPFTRLKLECDGLTKVLSYVLREQNVRHQIKYGRICYGQFSTIHFWIEVGDLTVDYRARMLLGIGNQDEIPHGVFHQQDYPAVHYQITDTLKKEVSEFEFELLTIDWESVYDELKDKI